MKNLIIVRHCKSSWSDPYLSDFDRSLNNRGINDGNLMSDFLSKKISDIDLLLSSSSNRTVLTSKFFIKKININDIKYDDSLYHANSDIILNKIKKTNNKLNQLMIIGHNPGLTSLINYLSNIRLYNLPTTGIAIFNLNSKSWNEITSPKYLELDLIKFPKDLKS